MQAPESHTLSALVEELAAERGPEPALTFDGRTCTPADFRDLTVAFAKALHADGVRKGDKIGLLMGNRTEWLVVAFAIQHLGATLVPLNTWYTAPELEYVLEHADVSVLIGIDRFLKTDYLAMLRGFEPLNERFPLLRIVVILGDQGAGTVSCVLPGPRRGGRRRGDRGDPACGVATDMAFMLYTSGSTVFGRGRWSASAQPRARACWRSQGLNVTRGAPLCRAHTRRRG